MATLNTLEMEMRFPLWTLDKLSFKLNLTPQSLRKMCREKEIKSILIGRSYMISDDALQDFLNENTGKLSKAGRPFMSPQTGAWA